MDAFRIQIRTLLNSLKRTSSRLKLITAQPLPKRLRVQWTPTLVLLDTEGEEHNHTVGFLPLEELLPPLMLGIGKSHFDHDEFSQAENTFQHLLAETRTTIPVLRRLTILGSVGTSGPTTRKS